MIHPSPEVARRHTDALRAIGAAASSCTGVGGAITIAINHGSTLVALVVFGTMQVLGACEFLAWWWLKSKPIRLHEELVRLAAVHPENEDLRTLLVDFASTTPDGTGERVPVRHRLS